MRTTETANATTGWINRRPGRARGFTLVELLTVMFIISLLIAILVPSLNAARNSAKKTTTRAALNSLATGLDLFRTDNEREFCRTNGYPPSFAYPRMVNKDGTDIFRPYLGECPFLDSGSLPVITGAHWLPAMLMGFDQNGYVKRSTVPKKDNLRDEPWRWYEADPLNTGRALERTAPYADPGGLKTIRTRDLPGRPNGQLYDESDFDNFLGDLPVIVDAFSQPILYYVSNDNGRPTNMVEDERDEKNVYTGGDQREGPPFYFHQDNRLFTGTKDEPGWDFDGEHQIADPGADLNADELSDSQNARSQKTFARFILDRTLLRSLEAQREQGEGGGSVKPNAPLRPANPDSYLLISAGVDGRYGTSDDVTNFPLEVE